MGKPRVIASPHDGGMVLHVVKGNGTKHFLMLHRYDSDLYCFLRDGKSIAGIYSYKPGRNKREQQLYKSLRHIIRLVDWIDQYDEAA